MHPDKKLVDELERRLSALADDGATAERVAAIEQMLLDSPELQDVYWSWMDVHIVLGVERTATLGEASDTSACETCTPDPAPLVNLAVNSQNFRKWAIGSLVALATCVVWALLVLRSQLNVGDGADKLLAADPPLAESSWSIPRITYVSWDGPVFANRSTVPRPPAAPQVGSVHLELSNGQPAGGYVLRLNPGETAELMLAIDAIAENNCSVIEMDVQGTPIRRVVSFNNFQPDPDPRTRRCGLGGTWVEKNDTDKPRYYLINGIHKRYHPSSSTADRSQLFQLSAMQVIFDTPDLVVIGWDDGGLDASEFHGAIPSDRSFDDLTIVIRLRGPDMQKSSPKTPYRIRRWTSPRRRPPWAKAPHTDGFDRYRFSVQPGETVVLNVGSEAKLPNTLYLVDERTGAVVWSVDNAGVHSHHLGAVALENLGAEAMDLAVFGECLPTADGEAENRSEEWACSELLKLYGETNCAILGLRDRVRKGEFVDLRVTLMTMSPHLSGLFDEHRFE